MSKTVGLADSANHMPDSTSCMACLQVGISSSQLLWAGLQGLPPSQHVISVVLHEDEDLCGGLVGRPHLGLSQRLLADHPAMPPLGAAGYLDPQLRFLMVQLHQGGACVLLVHGVHWHLQV